MLFAGYTADKTILCYGDSNTFGHDPSSTIGGRYPRGIRWTGLLCAKGWHVINCGLNGRQIPEDEVELQAAAEQIASHLPAAFIAVMLGTNDLLWNPALHAEDAVHRMNIFLSRLRVQSSDSALLLIAPPPMEAGDWVMEERLLTESRRLAPLYADLASDLGISFCNAGAWSIGIGFDGVHFTQEGHARFAQCLSDTLTALC